MERSLEYDLDFLISNPNIIIGLEYMKFKYIDFIHKKINDFKKINKKFTIVIYLETIRDENLLHFFNNLLHDLNKDGYEVYLSMNTLTYNSFYLHPLTNCIQYKNFFNGLKSDYFLNDENKIHNSILSIRRKNKERDLFFKKYDKNFNGIFRYLNVDMNIKNKNSELAPNKKEFISEMKSSYVGFTFETITMEDLVSFTEKTMLLFLSKTLPIVYLKNSNHLKLLEDMGFYLLNREIGYLGIDGTLEEKINEFIKCVDFVNDIKTEELKNIYNKNIKKINNNFKIVYEIIYSNKHYPNKMSNTDLMYKVI